METLKSTEETLKSLEKVQKVASDMQEMAKGLDGREAGVAVGILVGRYFGFIHAIDCEDAHHWIATIINHCALIADEQHKVDDAAQKSTMN